MLSRQVAPYLRLVIRIVFILFAALILIVNSPVRAAPNSHASLPDVASELSSPTAPLDVLVSFRVVVERVRATSNFDGPFGWDRADFYARVRIGDQVTETPVFASNADDVRPERAITKDVRIVDFEDDAVSITIEIWDADDWNNRNMADLTGDDDKGLLLSVGVDECLVPGTAGSISGSVSGSCGQTLTSSGTEPSNTAEIFFRIEAVLPATAPGLHVRCFHKPLWPQAGDVVTVEAAALYDNLVGRDVDEIEVWFGSSASPLATCTGTSTCSAQQTAPSSGNSMSYECRVRDGTGPAISSGPKRTHVGESLGTRAVPVLFTGPSSGAIDIVFVPDQIDFTNAKDPDFLMDVHTVILSDYYGDRLFLDHQDKFNFWVAVDSGNANGFTAGPCVSPPGNWGSDYSFADTGAVVHSRLLKDCALRHLRVFSIDSRFPRRALNLTAHSPFGLADEICCGGDYEIPDSLPNIYNTNEECQGDVINLQAFDILLGDFPRTTESCRQLADGRGSTQPFFTSEPPANDLMLDLGPLNAADYRRIDDALKNCGDGGCGAPATAAAAAGGTPAAPFPSPDLEDTTKTVLVQLAFDGREAVSVQSVSVNYGHLPENFANPPMLQVDVYHAVSGQQRLMDRFNEWHPLLKTGTLQPVGEFEFEHGPTEWLEQTTGNFLLPFSVNLAAVTITDLELDRELITVDLTEAVQAFCKEHAEDPDCQAQEGYVLQLPLIRR